MTTLTKAGRYELREELGRGAMGVVYRAHDPVIGRDVAVKTLHLVEAGTGMTREELVSRFQVEARAAGLLTHPNIVVVYDAGEEEGVFYITMELVEGRSLQALVDLRQTFPLPRVIRVMEQACSALDFAHQRNVVHRDIKPANLMLTEDDSLKITDFGTAKILQFGTAQTTHVMGTPSYMSPEQVMGKPVDGRSDIFSLGVILYELMTGEKPFPGENITTVIYKIINEEPIPPRELDSSIHPGLSAVITHALSKDPASRFQTCSELMDALKNYHDVVSPEATVRMAPARAPSVAAQGMPGAAAPMVAAKAVAQATATTAAPASQPAFGTMRVEEPAKKRGGILLTLFLLGIIGYTSHRIWPQVREVWQRMQEPDGAPPIIQKIVPKAPAISKVTPESDAEPASQTAPLDPGAELVAPQASTVPIQPAALVPAVASTSVTKQVTQKSAPPAESPAAAALKRKLDSELVDLAMADRVKLRVSGNTLTLSGRLNPTDYEALLTHLRNVPAGVHVVDEIQYAGAASAPPATATNQSGWAWVRSTPPGAQISVDGKDTGLQTPAKLELTPGDHEVIMNLDGFSDAHRTVRIRTGENVAFTELLERQ